MLSQDVFFSFLVVYYVMIIASSNLCMGLFFTY